MMDFILNKCETYAQNQEVYVNGTGCGDDGMAALAAALPGMPLLCVL